MKKKFLVLGLCLTIAGAFALTACGNTKSGTPALKANDAYGIGAVSTVKLMGSRISAQAVVKFSALGANAATIRTAATEDDVISQAEKFNEYFTALDSFLGDDIVSTSTQSNPDAAYPYEIKMIVKGKDVTGDSTEYVMYYTETLSEETTSEEEVEKTYTLDGIMVLDGKDYHLEGERSAEQENKETENELKIRAYADKDDKTTYIEMAQEVSVENNETETEYVYSVVIAGELIEQTAVEFETERKEGKEESEYELEFRKGDAKGRYKIARETKENKVEIKVKYDMDGKSGEFRIREKTDENGNKQYEYTFSDNSVKVM